MNKLVIQSVSGATYPLYVYVSDSYGNNQTYLGNIPTGPIPPVSAEFTNIPMLLQTAPQIMVTVVDSNGCGKFGLFNCSGLELKLIVQEGPYFALQSGGNMIAQQFSSSYSVSSGDTSPNCSISDRNTKVIHSPSIYWYEANRFFLDDSMTTPFDGQDKWYANDFDFTKQLQIDMNGYVIATNNCP